MKCAGVRQKVQVCMYSKTCLKGPLKKEKKLVFKTNYRLNKVKSIAECYKGKHF